jgi:hypothetical protein
MAVVYTWKIVGMSTMKTPEPGYVVSVNWTVTGVDGEYSAFAPGSTEFSETQSGTFIPYDQLTPEIVISWVQASLGPQQVAMYENSIAAQIQVMISPPDVPTPTPLPWTA